MRTGPLRRVAGTLGLLALAPTAWLLASGQLTVVEAAWRAAITLLLVMLLGRIAGWFVEALALSVQPQGEAATETQNPRADAAPSYARRREDQHARQAAGSGDEVDEER